MKQDLDTQHVAARRNRKSAALTSAFIAANSAIDVCLGTLNTADKNRLLLALHAQIGEQLEALDTTTND